MNADIMLWTSLNGSRPRDPGTKFSLGADVSEGDWPTSPCPPDKVIKLYSRTLY